jgi:hypothetical protein
LRRHWVNLGKAHFEHITSALRPFADIEADIDFRRFGPKCELDMSTTVGFSISSERTMNTLSRHALRITSPSTARMIASESPA